eukprot:5785972-Amphidinium_carterae.1
MPPVTGEKNDEKAPLVRPGFTSSATAHLQDQSKPLSIGSEGHPVSCLMPCKYYWKPRGCKDGLNCKRCHICPWQPQLGRAVPKPIGKEVEKTASELREE